MSPSEVAWRLRDRVRQEVWAHRTFGPPTPAPPQGTSAPRTADTAPAQSPRQVTPFPASVNLDTLPEEAHRGLISVAQGLLGGRFDILGTLREDMADPTWSLDPLSGQSYPDDRCAFQIDFRSAADPRNVKQVWELSRHHHLTVLGLAWRLTGDDRYADMAARHLRSWWKANPVLCGVNWSSGIELGIRLISWVWTRRLLDGWTGASTLFEENGVAVHQIYWHQRYLAAFRSRGSSANNHVVAEAAGQLVTSCAFPWFAESPRWRDESTRLLEEQLLRNTFSDGLNREQAFDYHGLVAELGLVAAVEAEWAGTPIGETSWTPALLNAGRDGFGPGPSGACASLRRQRRRSGPGPGRPGRRSMVIAPCRRGSRLRLPSLVASGHPRRGEHPVGRPGRTHRGHRPSTRGTSLALLRRRSDHPALAIRSRRGDLVSVRRWPPRFLVYRRPRSCRRAVHRAAPRWGRAPGRSGNVLLSRRTGLAPILPLHHRPQHP